jgi:hypothetical protein
MMWGFEGGFWGWWFVIVGGFFLSMVLFACSLYAYLLGEL